MQTLLALTIPGVVLLLLAVWMYESLRQRRGKGRGTPLATTYVNELTALFHGTKRTELDHRASTSLMYEQDAQGAPPGFEIDLDRGIVVLRPTERDTGPAAGR